jgi:hypothetical protein
VRTLVVLEKDYTAGRLSEAEIAFRAQDNEGDVWHMAEYPEEYEKGKFVDAPAWIAGLKGARAGIAMLAKTRAWRSRPPPRVRARSDQLARPRQGLQGGPADLRSR